MTAVHELVAASEMTTDPALLDRWFCACGEVLDRHPVAAIAMDRHLKQLDAAGDAEAAARRPAPDDVPLFPIDGEDQT